MDEKTEILFNKTNINNDIYQDLEFFSGNNNDKINEEKNNSILSNFLNKILTIKLIHLEEMEKEKNMINTKEF